MGQDFGYDWGDRVMKRIEEAQKQTEKEEYNRLLDMFAGQACASFIVAERFTLTSQVGREEMAQRAYLCAKAMLEVRCHYAR